MNQKRVIRIKRPETKYQGMIFRLAKGDQSPWTDDTVLTSGGKK